jgi:hypothetical protein
MTGGAACASCGVYITSGQTLTAGTTILPGSARVNGRAMLWLLDPAGNVVASNQGYQGTYNAYFTYRALSSGNYLILEGYPSWSSSCTTTVGYGSGSATVAWSLTALTLYVAPPPPPSGMGCVHTRGHATFAG